MRIIKTSISVLRDLSVPDHLNPTRSHSILFCVPIRYHQNALFSSPLYNFLNYFFELIIIHRPRLFHPLICPTFFRLFVTIMSPKSQKPSVEVFHRWLCTLFCQKQRGSIPLSYSAQALALYAAISSGFIRSGIRSRPSRNLAQENAATCSSALARSASSSVCR